MTSEILAGVCQERFEGEDHEKAHTKRRRDVCTFLDLDRKTDKFTVRYIGRYYAKHHGSLNHDQCECFTSQYGQNL